MLGFGPWMQGIQIETVEPIEVKTLSAEQKESRKKYSNSLNCLHMCLHLFLKKHSTTLSFLIFDWMAISMNPSHLLIDENMLYIPQNNN